MHVVHKKRGKKNIYIFVLLVVVALIIINPFNLVSTVRSFTASIFAPIQSTGQSVGRSIGSFFSLVTNIGEITTQNHHLLQKNRDLEAQVAQIHDLKRENEQLRAELDLAPRGKYDLLSAEVVSRDTVGGNHWIMVNKGSHDGVEESMAVVVGEGVFVGYIDLVDNRVSRVRLVTHPESVVTVLDAKSGAEAIAHGRHGLSIFVQDIEKGDEVHDGDTFITSRVGNRFPQGLSVGTAQNVAISDDGLFQSANIIPAADLNDLSIVSIIKNVQ